MRDMKISLISLILVFYSCSRQESTSYTVKDLINLKGEPSKIKDSYSDKTKSFYLYSDSKFQVETQSQVVEAKFLKPIGDERFINHWKEKFQDQYYKISKNKGSLEEYSFEIPSKGLRIVFNDSGTVQWIESRGEL